MTIARHLKQASLALLMLSSLAVLQNAYAVGTPSGTTISNQATVNYSVGGVPQTPISSTVAAFVVDNRIDLTVAELSGGTTVTSPGVVNVVTAFTVTNTGNTAQGFVLSATNQASSSASPFAGGTADNQDVNNLRWFAEAGAVPGDRQAACQSENRGHCRVGVNRS
jgi:hypothetical protein